MWTSKLANLTPCHVRSSRVELRKNSRLQKYCATNNYTNLKKNDMKQNDTLEDKKNVQSKRHVNFEKTNMFRNRSDKTRTMRSRAIYSKNIIIPNKFSYFFWKYSRKQNYCSSIVWNCSATPFKYFKVGTIWSKFSIEGSWFIHISICIKPKRNQNKQKTQKTKLLRCNNKIKNMYYEVELFEVNFPICFNRNTKQNDAREIIN